VVGGLCTRMDDATYMGFEYGMLRRIDHGGGETRFRQALLPSGYLITDGKEVDLATTVFLRS
jgi:hypothetical protein